MISPELYLKSLFSSFIKYPQSLPVDIRENYPNTTLLVYDTFSDNSEEWIVADLENLQLFILMISRLKKVLAYCIDITDSDYNRVRKRDQLVRKLTLKRLAKVLLNGWVFALKVIRRQIQSYYSDSNFRYSIYSKFTRPTLDFVADRFFE